MVWLMAHLLVLGGSEHASVIPESVHLSTCVVTCRAGVAQYVRFLSSQAALMSLPDPSRLQ